MPINTQAISKTPHDFLRQIEKRNDGPPLPPNAILVTIDVSALYTNIPQEEGLNCTRATLDESAQTNIGKP